MLVGEQNEVVIESIVIMEAINSKFDGDVNLMTEVENDINFSERYKKLIELH